MTMTREHQEQLVEHNAAMKACLARIVEAWKRGHARDGAFFPSFADAEQTLNAVRGSEITGLKLPPEGLAKLESSMQRVLAELRVLREDASQTAQDAPRSTEG